jgi:hypothetical protein
MNIIRRHTDNKKLLLICILLLSHFAIITFCYYHILSYSLGYFFYQYMVEFLFNIVIYVFLLKESMYSYCCVCIIVVIYIFLLFVQEFLSLSMYTYCCVRILRRGYPD